MLKTFRLLQRKQFRNLSFVSKHNTSLSSTISSNDIEQYLGKKNLVYSMSNSHFKVRECPFCHSIKGKRDNMFKLHIEREQGVFFCHRCGASGSWYHFKQKLGADNLEISSARDIMENNENKNSTRLVNALDKDRCRQLQYDLLKEDKFKNVLEYLTGTAKGQRGITLSILDKFGVGCMEMPYRNKKHENQDEDAVCAANEDRVYITFPWMVKEDDLKLMNGEFTNSSSDMNVFRTVRFKARCWSDKSKQLLLPKGGSWGLFGWNTVPSMADSIVLTEGEYDAMAVNQSTGLPAVSLPNGCRSLPPEVLPLLEKFSKVVLWLDHDVPGQESVDKFAAKIGLKRCYVVRPEIGKEPCKDANDALLSGRNIQEMIDNAQLVPHEQIATFEQLREQVFQEILNPDLYSGVPSRFFPTYNKITKGFRMGEVSILTGPTGCGKTTLLSQMSMDFCQQGVNTLWGSFEIKNTRLLRKMLTQMHGSNLSNCSVSELKTIGDRFQQLPMYFMRFFGSTDVDQVLDAMEHAVYAFDVQHIILDNVQFMMSGQGRGFDKFERQDAALDKFRKFATANNIHLSLVIHPRKEQEDVELTLTSVFGTAKATQEADNVLILQRDRKNKELKLDIRKNRFDGTLGHIPLNFDMASNRLGEKMDETSSQEESTHQRTTIVQNTTQLSYTAPSPYLEPISPPEDLLAHVEDTTIASIPDEDQETLQNRFRKHGEPFSKFNNIVHQ